jgi:hypothetical protein
LGVEVVIAGEETSGGSLLVAAEAIEALSSDGVGWDESARSKTKVSFEKYQVRQLAVHTFPEERVNYRLFALTHDHR